MRDRILSAQSVQEVDRLLNEASEFRNIRPDVERRIVRAAQQRKNELR